MKIICLHQSSELYGSDRSFLQVIQYLKKSGRFEKISIIIPRDGPLVEKLLELGVEVLFMPISLLSKTYLKTFQWHKILFPLFLFGKKRRLMASYDIVYVNTSVILDFYLLAPFLEVKKIIHIREIPSKWLGKILTFCIKASDAFVIFNSFSTKESFGEFRRFKVVHNAFEGFANAPKQIVSPAGTDLKILLIGRVNHWKGQDFAIEALAQNPHQNICLRIVGSPFVGNEDVLDNLKNRVEVLQLTKRVQFVDFVNDAQAEYAWADLVIVPSKKPEPFGRIAIEAMSMGLPVVAANHGGLPEIVENGVTGFLFEPNEIASFNTCINAYLEERKLLETHGIGSKALFEKRFSIDILHHQLDSIFFEQ
jgi:glycosyltransferase involved in cell wall biosynthesis